MRLHQNMSSQQNNFYTSFSLICFAETLTHAPTNGQAIIFCWELTTPSTSKQTCLHISHEELLLFFIHHDAGFFLNVSRLEKSNNMFLAVLVSVSLMLFKLWKIKKVIRRDRSVMTNTTTWLLFETISIKYRTD